MCTVVSVCAVVCAVVSVSVYCGVCQCVLWCLSVCAVVSVSVYCGVCCGVCQRVMWSGEGSGLQGELIQNGFIFVLIVPLTVLKTFSYSTDLRVKRVLMAQLEPFCVGDV